MLLFAVNLLNVVLIYNTISVKMKLRSGYNVENQNILKLEKYTREGKF